MDNAQDIGEHVELGDGHVHLGRIDRVRILALVETVSG